MTRLLIALALVAALPLNRAQERPSAQLVIDAVAVDRDGRPVTDLRREELEVWIGGFRIPFESFRSVTAADERSGRLVVLILDDLALPLTLVPRARDVARHFVNRMTPGDRMAIIMLSGGIMEHTDDRRQLLKRLDAYTVRAQGPLRLDSLGEQVLKSVTSIARGLSEGAYGRKTIVGIGASWLFDTPIPPPTIGRELRQQWTDAMRAMAFANAAFYVIEPAGIGAAPFPGGSGGFARQTGGFAFVNTNDLNGAADRIMREAANYYLLTVADPPVQRAAVLRELDVRVLRKNVTVRARRATPGKE
jgi:VWFA-related protein